MNAQMKRITQHIQAFWRKLGDEVRGLIKVLKKNKTKTLFISTICKYSIALLFALSASIKGGVLYFLAGILELAIIALVSNEIVRYRWGRIVNAVLVLMFNVQMVVFVFGSSYVSALMLSNLDSIEDLSGLAVLYILSALLVVAVSVLPVMQFKIPWSGSRCLSAVLAAELVFVMMAGNSYSPLYAYFELIQEEQQRLAKQKEIENMDVDASEFYRKQVEDFVAKPANLPDKPNVVVIFTEGLSQRVIDSPKNLMPNVADYQKKSLSFTNYYNHTFATYRGIIGQLYSGYQQENYDSNELVSLQDLFSDEGYETAFINTEPNNAPFTVYLNNLDFDSVIGSPGDYSGAAHSLSDREAYEKLYSVMEEKESSAKPYFISIYTFGTHMSFNAKDQEYGDGSVAQLNKFYNADYYFGEFMEKFENSPMAEDTVIIFTADHCTYRDNSYIEAFPEEQIEHISLDRIPFFIYYRGVTPEEKDVGGRNSLDFAPTICDYLDISGVNYFLGISVYADRQTNYDTIYSDSYTTLSSRGGVITGLSDMEEEIFNDGLYKYYAFKTMKQ